MPEKKIFLYISLFILTSVIFVSAFSVSNPKIPSVSLGANNGDCDGDGYVDLFDYGYLSRSFGLTQGQSGFDGRCDFHVDQFNIIDLFDYQILANNFGRQGTTPVLTITPGPTNPPGQIVGYGKNTVGGSGGTIYNVSGLDALKTCVGRTGKRVCKIIGSGVWDGQGLKLEINNPGITIDGEGANVQFKDFWLHISTSEVIIRHVRARVGDLNVAAGDADAISINGGTGTGIKNIVIDHVEAIWGPDVSFTILNNVTDITVQNSIIGWGLSKSAHPEALQDADGHNLAFNISGISGSVAWPKRVTVYKNLIGGAQGRYTRAMGAEATDIVNNIYYNFDESPQGNPHSLNFVGNILKWGPAPQAAGLAPAQDYVYRATTSGDFPNQFSNAIYEADNLCINFSGCNRNGPGSAFRSNPASAYSVIPVAANSALFDSILSNVGPRPMDSTSQRWINEAKNGTGTYFNGAGYPPPNPFW